jgi:hypothetical protein
MRGSGHPLTKRRSMKSSTSMAVRANVVLLSMSTACAAVCVLSIGLLLGCTDGADEKLKPCIIVLASILIWLVRRAARHAFHSALMTHKVQFVGNGLDEALIVRDHPAAWLVQLHLELRGIRCSDL